MIPASYLFKDIYKQHWEDAAEIAAVAPDRHRYLDGLLTPIAGAISALVHLRDRQASACTTGEAKTAW